MLRRLLHRRSVQAQDEYRHKIRDYKLETLACCRTMLQEIDEEQQNESNTNDDDASARLASRQELWQLLQASLE